jgi:hypothetical protein
VINRRRFVNSGILASAAVVSGIARSAADEAPASFTARQDLAAHLDLALFDSRFRCCRAFADALARRSVATAAFNGDVTHVWYTKLDPAWRVRPMRIAGMTTEGALFCLERLAWDHGMRVVYRGSHRPQSDGSTDHVLEASARQPQGLAQRHGTAEGWPSDVVSLISRLSDPLPISPAQHAGIEQHRFRSRPGRNRTDLDAPLFSWVIAPRSSVS